MSNTAFLAIDVQRGFMPLRAEGEPQVDGFGELGVPGGETIVEPLNRFIGWAALQGMSTATTQDWHPHETAHFAPDGEQPNFTTTWPRHCVDGTPGAELHPDFETAASTRRFIKGCEVLERGEDDLSYSGYYAEDPTTGISLPEWLMGRKVHEVVLGGLALDYCVGKTALDLLDKTTLDVTVLTDLTKPVAQESGDAMLTELVQRGARLMTSDEYINLHETA